MQPVSGPGMVWVNTSSKVYHCYGGRDYGTTKVGKYESEASAKAEGARPAYGVVVKRGTGERLALLAFSSVQVGCGILNADCRTQTISQLTVECIYDLPQGGVCIYA